MNLDAADNPSGVVRVADMINDLIMSRGHVSHSSQCTCGAVGLIEIFATVHWKNIAPWYEKYSENKLYFFF